MSSDSPSRSPIAQKLEVLLDGTGFNFYGSKEQIRSDDLLVRQKAAAAISDAVKSIESIDSAYRREHVPPATRENPYPPHEVMERVRQLSQLRDRMRDLSARILGMPAPAQDKVWFRFRREMTVLQELFVYDTDLLETTKGVEEAIRQTNASSWQSDGPSTALQASLDKLDQIVRERWQLLQMPS